MDLLEEKGSGHPMKMVVCVDDFDGYCSNIKSKGIQLVEVSTGVMRFPSDVSCGMLFEIAKSVAR